MTARRPIPLGVLAAVAAVVVLLVVPAHVDLPIAWLSASHLLGNAAAGGTPLWWALEDVANVAMFVPLGFVLGRWVPMWGAVIGGVALSTACEVAQTWIPNRHASLLDVLMNAIGVVLGVGLARIRRNSAARRESAPADGVSANLSGSARNVRNGERA